MPVQQQEMNDIQVRSSVVNNSAAMSTNNTAPSPNNERKHEATIEVAIASPEDEAVEATVTTAALVNNSNNTNATNATDKDNTASNEEVPQVKISNL